MLLSEALKEFDLAMTGTAADSTRTWYRQRVGSVVAKLGDADAEAVTISDLRRWRASLVGRDRRWSDHPGRPEVAGGLSPWTVRGYVRAARRFFNWLVEEELLDSSPALRLKLPPKPEVRPKATRPADVLAMLTVANTRDRAIVCFLAATGCRVGGLCNLRLADLALECDLPCATVREKGRGGKKSRTVYLGNVTAAAMKSWLKIRQGSVEEDHVFVGLRGPLKEGGVYQVLKRLAEKAGVKGRFNPHAFRHGFARGALENGADLGTVSQLLGHSGVGVTSDFYGRWTPTELGKRHARFSWFEQGTLNPLVIGSNPMRVTSVRDAPPQVVGFYFYGSLGLCMAPTPRGLSNPRIWWVQHILPPKYSSD